MKVLLLQKQPFTGALQTVALKNFAKYYFKNIIFIEHFQVLAVISGKQ